MREKRAYEFIVIGCGGIGSAASYWLSRSAPGEVLALEQFQLGHDRGGSQDHSRIIRLSYHDPTYIALAPAAYEHWHHVEEESGIQLVVKAGGLDLERIGTTGSKNLSHCAAAMDEREIPYESLSADEIMHRWPQFQLPENVRGLYQSDGGLVDARRANAVHVALARLNGVTIQEQTAVRSIRSSGQSVEVKTDEGTYTAGHVVVTSGAWTNAVLGSLGIAWPLTVTQEQVTYYATPHIREFTPDRFPVWIWRAGAELYGLPVYGEIATKASQDTGGDEVTADSRTFEPNPRIERVLAEFISAHIPRFLGPVLYTKTCLYTMPPDRNFVIDSPPDHPRVTVAVGAGHAFKFASLIGRILSDLAGDGKTQYPIKPFKLDRPALTDPAFPPQFRNESVIH